MPETAIELRHVGKRYTKYDDTPLLLTSAAERLRRRSRRAKLWAVRGVDLEVPRGSSYGIIGRNGSGKTTLLSVMAGVTAPSEGSVRVWGRTAPLIAVGVGFHRELTGRENVYLNGTMLGMTKRQLHDRLEAIVDFAEISEFLDTPVKFYSSGMYVRLGFAVAIHSDPDVLLVDEVLAVGDLGFQMKCFERMHALRAQGTTTVVISHNLGALQAITEKILLMNKSRPDFFGEPGAAIARFHELLDEETELQVDRTTGLHYQPGILRADYLELLDEAGRPVSRVVAGAPLTVRLGIDAMAPLDDVVVGFALTGPDGQIVYSETTADRSLGAVATGEHLAFTIALDARLPSGSYSMVGWVQRTDLKTLLARSRPASFYVSGRVTVAGTADLQGRIARQSTDPGAAWLAGRLANGALLGPADEPEVPEAAT